MGFLDIGNKNHQGQHLQEHLRPLSNDGDYVTFHWLLQSVFGLAFRRNAYLVRRAVLILYDQVLNSSSRDIELNLSEMYHHQQQHELLSGTVDPLLSPPGGLLFSSTLEAGGGAYQGPRRGWGWGGLFWVLMLEHWMFNWKYLRCWCRTENLAVLMTF